MASTKIFTISYGATELTLEYVTANSASPEEAKNFTEHILENNARVRDTAGKKRRWTLSVDVPLSSQQKTDLNTLYAVNAPLTLTDSFWDTGSSYSVHFENKQTFYNSPDGDAHYVLTFQEL